MRLWKNNLLRAATTIALAVLCTHCTGLGAPTVGGWDTKPKSSATAKPANKPIDAPVYPAALQAAVDKFQTTLAADQKTLDAAKKVQKEKLQALRTKEEPRLRALLASETIRLTKMNQLKEAKVCKTLLDNYEPGNVDWAKVPSGRITSSYKRLLIREAAVERGEKNKITGKQGKLNRNAKTNSKPVFSEFDKLIAAAEKASDLDRIIKWKQEKNVFRSRMPGNDPSAADASLLFFYRFTPKHIFKKGSSVWVRDLSPARQDGKIADGTLSGEKSAYPHFEFESGGVSIPALGKMSITTSTNFTICLQVKINKPKKAMALAYFGTFKDNVGILTTYISSYYINRIIVKPLLVDQWHSLVLLQKGANQYFFINGKLSKTAATKPINNKLFQIGGDKAYPLAISLGEIRFYSRAITNAEIQKFVKDSAPKR